MFLRRSLGAPIWTDPGLTQSNPFSKSSTVFLSGTWFDFESLVTDSSTESDVPPPLAFDESSAVPWAEPVPSPALTCWMASRRWGLPRRIRGADPRHPPARRAAPDRRVGRVGHLGRLGRAGHRYVISPSRSRTGFSVAASLVSPAPFSNAAVAQKGLGEIAKLQGQLRDLNQELREAQQRQAGAPGSQAPSRFSAAPPAGQKKPGGGPAPSTPITATGTPGRIPTTSGATTTPAEPAGDTREMARAIASLEAEAAKAERFLARVGLCIAVLDGLQAVLSTLELIESAEGMFVTVQVAEGSSGAGKPWRCASRA